MSPISECPCELIKGWCSSLKPTNSVSEHSCNVLITSTRYPRNKAKNTHDHDVVGICSSLIFTLNIQAIKYEFNFNLLPGVVVDQVVSPSRDNICISSLKFFTSKANSMVSMPIVFVEKCKTPVRTIFFSQY